MNLLYNADVFGTLVHRGNNSSKVAMDFKVITAHVLEDTPVGNHVATDITVETAIELRDKLLREFPLDA